jgi:hypothetical protein
MSPPEEEKLREKKPSSSQIIEMWSSVALFSRKDGEKGNLWVI